MTLIDFYILPQESEEAQHHFACRLIEKAVKQGNRVMITTNSEQESQILDDALWSFRPDAFVPHTLTSCGEEDKHVPVLLSHTDDDLCHNDVLINLRPRVPEQFSRFHRLAEIVIQNKNTLEHSRNSYSFYKARGYPINTHKMP